MKNLALLTAAALCLLIASCSTSTKTHSRFGTWKKVSAQKGNWIGVRNLKSTAALGSIPAFKGEANTADTTAIDTSYIENSGVISLTVTPFGDLMPNVFRLNLIDSSASFRWGLPHFKYVSDSTAITNYKGGNGMRYLGETPNGYIYKLNINLINHCGHQQSKNEYVIFNIVNEDSTKHKVFKVRVDGLKKIADNIVSCKD